MLFIIKIRKPFMSHTYTHMEKTPREVIPSSLFGLKIINNSFGWIKMNEFRISSSKTFWNFFYRMNNKKSEQRIPVKFLHEKKIICYYLGFLSSK